ncbi:hypothetical protein BV898_16914 [Hypsibius exemplaris]|uniref:Uncharacterized protein n=1 Tax=Hypsibius exemplaris TaxID=2072580 RepID=A0A9X6RMA6_HYPEX|nr:hypothetical protein BV898_16914 [Hypsibius exemplaris]
MDFPDFFCLGEIYFGPVEEFKYENRDENTATKTSAGKKPGLAQSRAALRCVAQFLQRKLVDESISHSDLEQRVMSCTTQLLTVVGTCQRSLQQEDTFSLRALVDTLMRSQSDEKFLLRKALASGFALFEDLQWSYFDVSGGDLEGKMEIACCMLDHHQANLSAKSLRRFISDVLVDFTTDLSSAILFFLIRCLQSNRRDDVLDVFDHLPWEQLSTYLASSSARTYQNDFAILLNGLIDYSEDMPHLQIAPARLELFKHLSEWILSAQSINQPPISIVGFATVDLLNPTSCSCRLWRKPLLLILKSICICLRSESERCLNEAICCLKNFLQKPCAIHTDHTLDRSLCAVFGNDDDELCCALLCCLHLHLICSSTTATTKIESIPAPEAAFDDLLELISHDHFVLLSWYLCRKANEQFYREFILHFLGCIMPARLVSIRRRF